MQFLVVMNHEHTTARHPLRRFVAPKPTPSPAPVPTLIDAGR